MDAEVAPVLDRRGRPDRLERAAIGRRQRSLVSRRRGKYSRARLAGRPPRDLAVDATLRAAALRSGRGGASRVSVASADLRRKLREHRSPFAIALVLDNSYSVHAERTVEKAKGLTLRLLEDAAHRGDRVALVAFKSGVPEATVALPLTRSLALARRRLEAIPLSGRTPLADALRRARRVLRQEVRKHANVVPLVVCVTDGLPTVPLAPGGDPLADALLEALALRRAGIGFVAAQTATKRPGHEGACTALAAAADGVVIPFADLVPDTLAGLLETVEAGR